MKFKSFIIAICVVMLSAGFAFADTAISANGAASSASSVNGDQTTVQEQGLENLNILDNVGGIRDSFNSEGKRGFAIPNEVTYGPLINYYGKPLPSEGFQRVEELIMYSCWYTEGALESMLKGVEDAEAEFKVANEDVADAALASEDGETRWIKIVISKEKYSSSNFAFKGFLTARSEDRRTTMTEVMAKAALVAVKNGCNVIHFTAQGAVRDAQSFGWGIGFNTTQAQIYDGQDKSNVSAGGFGISGGTAGTRDKPWLQGFGLIDYTLEYPPLKVAAADAPAEEAPQTGNHTDAGSTQD